MATAMKAQDRASHQKRKGKRQTTDTLRANLASKKFGDLTSQEKDDLLKLLGIQFNLIKDDNEA